MLPETNQHVVINDSQPRVPMETQIKNSPMNQGNPITCMDMTKFLLKRTLSYRYSQFVSWKLTFKNIMKKISATPSEEVDVLISHLGIDSSRQAATIRKCNADNPETALNWCVRDLKSGIGHPSLWKALSDARYHLSQR